MLIGTKKSIALFGGLFGFLLGLLPGAYNVFIERTNYADICIQRFGLTRGTIIIIAMDFPYTVLLAVMGIFIGLIGYTIYWKYKRKSNNKISSINNEKAVGTWPPPPNPKQ